MQRYLALDAGLLRGLAGICQFRPKTHVKLAQSAEVNPDHPKGDPKIGLDLGRSAIRVHVCLRNAIQEMLQLSPRPHPHRAPLLSASETRHSVLALSVSDTMEFHQKTVSSGHAKHPHRAHRNHFYSKISEVISSLGLFLFGAYVQPELVLDKQNLAVFLGIPLVTPSREIRVRDLGRSGLKSSAVSLITLFLLGMALMFILFTKH